MKVVLQNLTKKFPGRGKKNAGEVTAVSGLTFEIPDGELVGLLGPSGCGKSTALNLISGLLKPTAGRIFSERTISLTCRRRTGAWGWCFRIMRCIRILR